METKIGNRKRQWFSQKVLPHEPFLRRWLQRILPPASDIDDLLQEAYARLLSMCDADIERSADAGPLVGRTVSAIAIERLRRQRVVPLNAMVEVRTLPELCSLPACGEPPAREELALLRRVLASLPRRSQQIFILCKVYGLSAEKVAAQLKMPQKTVERQIATGIRHCATRLLCLAEGHRNSLLSKLFPRGVLP